MSSYLVRFTPADAYFFGNEKNFIYPGAEVNSRGTNSYFIRSEKVPSQSTLFGTLRYMLLPVKHSDYNDYTSEDNKKNAEYIGEKSFNVEENNTFGKIKSMSPVFILSGNDILVPAPFDHMGGNEYNPIKEYKEADTPSGKAYYTEEYDCKEGLTSGYLNVSDGTVTDADDIFDTVVRTGINRFKDKKGFFKKEYAALKKGYSFGVYVNLEDDLVPANGFAYMGQGKSAFIISFEEKENGLADSIGKYLGDSIVYCLGDAFAPENLYEKTLFAAVKTKTYRAYTTNGGKVKKEAKLYNLISAGSVFIAENKEEFLKFMEKANAETIGYNTFVTKK